MSTLLSLLNGQTLNLVDSARYLRLSISIASELAFYFISLLLHRYLCKLYLIIVWPYLEYACEVWDPHLAMDKDTTLIEMVQTLTSRVCLKQWNLLLRYVVYSKHPFIEWLKKVGMTQYPYRITNGFTDCPSPPLLPTVLSSIVYIMRCPWLFMYIKFCRSLHFFACTISLWNSVPHHIVSHYWL